MIEKPYKGRATITETIQELTIEIPAKRNWFVLAFLSFWLCGWFAGELFALSVVLGAIRKGTWGAELFILIWLCGWTVGGFFAMRTWLIMAAGKEVISFNRGLMTTYTRFNFFKKATTYSIREMKNFSLNQPDDTTDWVFSNRKALKLNSSGVLKFDYGLKTILIADGIDEAEGRHLLEKIRERHFMTEEQIKI